ncbi:cysteine-tryptophan domain-containing zinc finger protein 7 isoform X2 [Diospyros lotus]|uniref:cysteine-tryptophan domain-containing zinc finger protein 7 isoform X2 n=1 Tax=Diospyros lotus TaxID=55363 RepID=UPI00225087A2|nr:cysteine-tryptophan domain-containing zinc finger protein 7 isoform X2 [Diospyros lotus]
MISLGSRDGRKGLGLGFGAAAEMLEPELEEGEACSYQNEDDSTIDPDIALSYIDVKLQDVLGHFQKDFEGGVVSAENLGAKFGGYGSFLPTYQRSPVWSRARSPPKVPNSNPPRSPNKLHLEADHLSSVVPSSASLSVRHPQASATAALLPLIRDSVDGSAKRVGVSSIHCTEESTSRSEPGRNYAPSSDQKTLKFRIKVGPDNLPTRKNAEIYSGLGLDISPSSSLDDSPTDTDGLSQEPQDVVDESPTSILQIMTSFPVHNNILLSPLVDDLIYLIEREKLHGENKRRFSKRSGQYSSNGSDSARGDDKRSKSFDKNACPSELKSLDDKDSQNGTGLLLKKETDIDSLVCEELVANTLKLPLLSNSFSVVNSTKDNARTIDNSREANQTKEEYLSGLAKGGTLEAISTQEIGLIEKPIAKAASAGTLSEGKKAKSQGDSLGLREEGGLREKADVSGAVDSNIIKERKIQNAESIDLLGQKFSKKAMPHEEDDIQLASLKGHSSSGGKNKSKGSNNVQSAEVLKDSSRLDSSLVSKNRKSTHANVYSSKGEMDDSKSQKDNGKARNRYSDFFGDTELEQEDDVDSVELPSIDRPKDLEVVEKNTLASNGTSKERLIGKKPSMPGAYQKAAPNAGPIGNGSISDAAPGTLGPLVKEDWVCCDKCQKWRLLPVGTNPESLPEKWLCSMLDWLPGRNRCTVSEEETTNAVIAMHQVSAPENQNNQHGHPGSVLPGLPMGETNCFDQSRQNLGFHPVPSGGKKKYGIKDVSDTMSHDGLALSSDSLKKNIPAPTKSRSLNGVNQSPASEIQPMHLSKSSVVEKHRHKKKEKNKSLEQHPNGGENRSSKIKSKRDNQDFVGISKKIRLDVMHVADEDWKSDCNGPVEEVGPVSNNSLSANAPGKDGCKYDDFSYMDGKSKEKKSSKDPPRKTKCQVQVTSDDGSLHMEKSDGKDVSRKRKTNESRDTHVSTASLQSGHHIHDRKDLLEHTAEVIHRKEKKAKISKSEGKETSVSKSSGGAVKKGRSMKEQQLGPDRASTLSQRSLDDTDSLRRGLGSAQPSQAATSSSSKVSGSHKNRKNVQEVKGSPVESVSSSPLRFSNPDKSKSTRRLEVKMEFGDAGFLAAGTPRRCSDGEDDMGSNRSGTVGKDEAFDTHFDSQGRNSGHFSGTEAKIQTVHSPELAGHHFDNSGNNIIGSDTQHPCRPQTSDQFRGEERENNKQYLSNAPCLSKPAKESSLKSKEKNGSLKSELDKGKFKMSDSYNVCIDHIPKEEKSRVRKNRAEQKFGVNSDKIEKNFVGKKESAGKVVIEDGKREIQQKNGGNNGLDVKVDGLSSQDHRHSDERSSRRYLSDKTDQVEVSGRTKLHSLPPSGRGQSESGTQSLQLNPGAEKQNEGNSLLTEPSDCDHALKAYQQNKKCDSQNSSQPIRSRHTTVNGQRVRDVEAPSPARRDPSSQAATNAVKEAKDLKHLADRLKNSGSSTESTGIYFQAALKFLHGACLLESSNVESSKQSEMIQSMQMYSSTAKLCEFCAHEYEKCKDMATAALAYKCMEVAYMRVIYSSHSTANRDRHELQKALQIVPLGESPSSSASDVDNLNNITTSDKVPLAKGVSSSQVAGNHVIAAQSRPGFSRLLNFAQDVNFAMEASRKSRIAFAAASARMEEAQYRDAITSVKKALDFNFQDIEGLLRLVRLAMEAISR